MLCWYVSFMLVKLGHDNSRLLLPSIILFFSSSGIISLEYSYKSWCYRVCDVSSERSMNLLPLFYYFFSITITCSQPSADPKKTDAKNFKFPPCQSCKILVKSFQEGMALTSRGKLEGGDTDWEEKNKLSYARSEIRYVEIMENICSKIEKGQHQCQSLAEENEHLLEEYWKNQDTALDLQDWFCNQKLKICCPDLHYGPECKPCSGYPDKVCSNNGKCKGSGTRKGNGQCSCSIGYEGESCNTCAPSFFESYKDDTKLLCSPCHHACEQACTQAGPRGCLACKAGWVRDRDQGCLDLNECMTLVPACSTNQFCVNNEGSYTCLACDKACRMCDGDGPDMCLECADGYVMRNNICEDGRKGQSERTLNVTRYITYLGLCVATCIVFQRNTVVASLIGLAVALYISVSEYMLGSGKATGDLNFNIGNVFPSA